MKYGHVLRTGLMIPVILLAGLAPCEETALTGRQVDAPSPQADASLLRGLWIGAWGGGERGDVNFQPVIAELFIEGSHIELAGFRNVGQVTGEIHFDPVAKQILVFPGSGAGVHPDPLIYTYELEGDDLVLTDRDDVSIKFTRRKVTERPLANAPIELVQVDRIDETGHLHVTEFTELAVGRDSRAFFLEQRRSLSTRGVTVLVVQESGCKEVSIDEAREVLRQPTQAVVAQRRDRSPPSGELRLLSHESGPPLPDSKAVQQAYSRVLRPGTLVFIFPRRDDVPSP